MTKPQNEQNEYSLAYRNSSFLNFICEYRCSLFTVILILHLVTAYLSEALLLNSISEPIFPSFCDLFCPTSASAVF